MKYLLFLFFLFSITSCHQDDENTPSGGSSQPDLPKSSKIISITLPIKHSINFEKDTLLYLALGDSYTIGSGVTEKERWPNQLTDSLRKIDIIVSKPRIVARSGWTTGNLIQELEEIKLEQKYDLVSLLIGVNNQYQGGSFPTFQSEFLDLLRISMEKSKSRSGVFVLSIPDYGVTPFGGKQSAISEEIDMYNSWIEETCKANGIKFYNITIISRKAENDLSLLALDQLHPSGKMYAEWINLMINDQLSLFDQ